MHFSREKLKQQAGWIILGFVVLVALGFLGYLALAIGSIMAALARPAPEQFHLNKQGPTV